MYLKLLLMTCVTSNVMGSAELEGGTLPSPLSKQGTTPSFSIPMGRSTDNTDDFDYLASYVPPSPNQLRESTAPIIRAARLGKPLIDPDQRPEMPITDLPEKQDPLEESEEDPKPSTWSSDEDVFKFYEGEG